MGSLTVQSYSGLRLPTATYMHRSVGFWSINRSICRRFYLTGNTIRFQFHQSKTFATLGSNGIDLTERVAPPGFFSESNKPFILTLDTEYGAIIRNKATSDDLRKECIRPLSVGWCLWNRDGKMVPGYPVHYLIKPSKDTLITESATSINGITYNIGIRYGRSAREVMSLLARDLLLVQGNRGKVVGHSARGDVMLIENEMYTLYETHENSTSNDKWLFAIDFLLNNTYCTLEPSSHLDAKGRWMKLSNMYDLLAKKHYVINDKSLIKNAHNASLDALMTGYCYFALVKKYKLKIPKLGFDWHYKVNKTLNSVEGYISSPRKISDARHHPELITDFANQSSRMIVFKNLHGHFEDLSGNIATKSDIVDWYGNLELVPKTMKCVCVLFRVHDLELIENLQREFQAVYDTQLKLWIIPQPNHSETVDRTFLSKVESYLKNSKKSASVRAIMTLHDCS